MMELPIEDARELWDGMESKSWHDLFDLTTENLNRPEGIDSTYLGEIQDLSQRMGDEPFPQNFDDFYQMINDRVED